MMLMSKLRYWPSCAKVGSGHPREAKEVSADLLHERALPEVVLQLGLVRHHHETEKTSYASIAIGRATLHQNAGSQRWRSKTGCFICNKTGHLVKDCKEKPAPLKAILDAGPSGQQKATVMCVQLAPPRPGQLVDHILKVEPRRSNGNRFQPLTLGKASF